MNRLDDVRPSAERQIRVVCGRRLPLNGEIKRGRVVWLPWRPTSISRRIRGHQPNMPPRRPAYIPAAVNQATPSLCRWTVATPIAFPPITSDRWRNYPAARVNLKRMSRMLIGRKRLPASSAIFGRVRRHLMAINSTSDWPISLLVHYVAGAVLGFFASSGGNGITPPGQQALVSHLLAKQAIH